jgi:hypothetical protein
MLTATPIRAVTRGSPAATSEPRVINRITAASEIATSSATPVGPAACSASPPASTVRPAARAVSAAASTSARLSAVTPLAATSNVTVAYATEPSWLTAWDSNGSSTRSTCAPSPNCVTAEVIADLNGSAVTCSPSGATKTTLASPVSAIRPGNRSCSSSMVCCDSVPGIEKSSSGADGAVSPAKIEPARIAIQARPTHARRSNANRPIPANNVAKGVPISRLWKLQDPGFDSRFRRAGAGTSLRNPHPVIGPLLLRRQ